MTTISYSDVLDALVDGTACGACAQHFYREGLSRCAILDGKKSPTDRPGLPTSLKQQHAAGLATADIEDDGFVTAHPTLVKAYD